MKLEKLAGAQESLRRNPGNAPSSKREARTRRRAASEHSMAGLQTVALAPELSV